ncbi:MAG: multicopper oxidase domain-containing protein [Alicyclobacillus sp.]|nr:multicopper oxidase domain-containing protein [Alicyclobacillus sp.]
MKRAVVFSALAVALMVAGCSQAVQPNSNTSSPDSVTKSTAAKSMMDNSTSTAQSSMPNQAPVPIKITRNGQNVTIQMTTEETNVDVGNGTPYHAWTFDGTLPGPVIYLQQGDHVTLTLHNIDPYMTHSIDLHAALVAPNKTFVQVPPNQSATLHFTAQLPGVYMYHCATAPMLMHIGNGMYGAVVVTPKGVRKPDYTIVQSEIYNNGDFQKMEAATPDLVVFNGKANQYVDHPLQAKVGQPLYIAFVNAGPNLFSAFHIVGTVLGDVEASGNPLNHLYDVQTYTVAPGDGALFKVTFNAPGIYPFVSHSMASADKGAMGEIDVVS